MKVAIMQPYFLPYIGYFQLIKSTDRFILFDDVQYIRHGWINRNRILKPNEGWQYITVSLAQHNREALIKEIILGKEHDNGKKILAQIEHYKKRAPYFKETREVMEQCLNTSELRITPFNKHSLQVICNYLSIPFNCSLSSELILNYSEVKDAGDWALVISEQIGANEYINPIAGKELFDEKAFSTKNIKLSFLEPGEINYNQRRNGVFEPWLSIIDVMMFNSKEEINNMLLNYQLQ